MDDAAFVRLLERLRDLLRDPEGLLDRDRPPLRAGGQILAYSGDTEWVEALLAISAEADLFICECYGYDKTAPYHLDWETLSAKLPAITAQRLLLTHMSSRMLARRDTVDAPRIALAEDGLVMEF